MIVVFVVVDFLFVVVVEVNVDSVVEVEESLLEFVKPSGIGDEGLGLVVVEFLFERVLEV